MAYSRPEAVFILEHYFASTSFAAIREAFSNVYPDKETPTFCSSVHHVLTYTAFTQLAKIVKVNLSRYAMQAPRGGGNV